MLKAGQCGSAVQLNAHFVHKRSGVAPYELGVVLEMLLRLPAGLALACSGGVRVQSAAPTGS